jgi:hypothetical protein
VAPVASAQQPGCVIAHLWRCDRCECEWGSVFQPLLV